ncbi:hypothetical protein D3C85_1018280 [compost metagenome]
MMYFQIMRMAIIHGKVLKQLLMEHTIREVVVLLIGYGVVVIVVLAELTSFLIIMKKFQTLVMTLKNQLEENRYF